jgi:hypothetical protein
MLLIVIPSDGVRPTLLPPAGLKALVRMRLSFGISWASRFAGGMNPALREELGRARAGMDFQPFPVVDPVGPHW